MRTCLRLSFAIAAICAVSGCTGISIAPSCPIELKVGESAPLLANEINPGAIAKYLWAVDPPRVGRVTDPTKPSTMFEAVSEGDAVIRLTASDGLYQVISQCQIRVAGTAQPPGGSDNGNSNENTNTNTNDNTSDNTNNNANDNANANTNDNTSGNTNDNTGDGKGDNTNDNRGGRPPSGGIRGPKPPTTP